MELFTEGTIKFLAENKQTRDSEVFFNPSRDFDRGLNVLFINALGRKSLSGIELFGGSGIRGLRLAAETKCFDKIIINDIKTSKTIAKNVSVNKKKLNAKVGVSSMNAQDIYDSAEGYDYLDIDPFGSPVKYMIQAMPKVKYGGILAITATDGAALYGKAKKACMLKYGAVSYKTRYFNEIGLRILIKRAEDIANLNDRSVEPLFFDVRRHYLRVYLKVKKANISRRIDYIYQCVHCPNRSVKVMPKCDLCGSRIVRIGPLWLDRLFDRNLVDRMFEIAEAGEAKDYTDILRKEEDTVSYYTTDELASYLKQKEKKLGLIGTKTVLDEKGFRVGYDFKELLEKYKRLK